MRLAERREREADVPLHRRPSFRILLARAFEQRRIIGGNSLLQRLFAAALVGEQHPGIAEIALGGRPIMRSALARALGQRLLIGGDCIAQRFRVAILLAERAVDRAEIVLGRRPVQRHASGVRSPSAASSAAIDFSSVPASPVISPSDDSALPMLFCSIAQSSGTRSRVNSASRPGRRRPTSPALPGRARARRASAARWRDCSGLSPSRAASVRGSARRARPRRRRSPRESHPSPAGARPAPAAPRRGCSGWSPTGPALSPA